MNTTPAIVFGDDFVPLKDLVPDPEPAALQRIESVLAGLDSSELIDLLSAIKAKIDSMPADPEKEDSDATGTDAAVPDAMDVANQRRIDAAHELESMAWVNGRGERIPLRLTSYRYAKYEEIRRSRRSTDAPTLITENEVLATRYLDSGLLLFLCSKRGLHFVDTPTPEILAQAAQWMDDNIPLGRGDAALGVANRLLDLVDLFVPVPRKSDDVDAAEDDEEDPAQKKTLRRDGNPDTSPSSANHLT